MVEMYLLTWNRDKMIWDDFYTSVESIKKGEKIVKRWASKSQQPKNGDEIYLLENGKGIIGHGYVERESYFDLHFESKRAEKGDKTNFIDIKFDWLVDSKKDIYVPSEKLKEEFPNQKWKTRASGIKIIEEYYDKLNKLINEIKMLNNKEINFEDIIKYFNKYAEKEYIKEKTDYRATATKAREAFIEYTRCIEVMLQGYKAGNCSNWNQQNQIGSNYFWVEFKRNDASDFPHSISVSINKYPEHDETGEVTLSFRVEAKDNDCEELDYNIHNKLIEIPLKKVSKLYYQASKYSKEKKEVYEDFSQDKKRVKKLVNNGSIKKVRILKNIIGPYERKNTKRIIKESLEAFEELKPFYEHIIKGRIHSLNKKVEEGEKMNYDSNIILYGPPGTGKTYNTIYYAVAICENKDLDTIKEESYTDVLKRYNDYKNDGKIEFTTFHQSYGYEEFIEGIKPCLVCEEESKKIENSLEYSIVPGIFKKFCEKAREGKQNDKGNGENYVFIIDEINRGNISKIFGELITLIEDTKREGENEHTSVRLPYSQTLFSVPNNVYIIGTMNTADRSISLMDTALRRRFQFIEMLPNLDIEELNKICIKDSNNKDSKINVQMMLKKINERIEILYDREHTIGHAMFLRLVQNPTIEVLASIFEKSIIPLLQEYFYEDYEKIQLILGDNGKKDNSKKFILEEKIEIEKIFNGSIDNFDIPNKKYSINKEAFNNQDSYKQIYEKVKKDD